MKELQVRHEGKIWGPHNLKWYASKGKGLKWATRQMILVIQGKKTMDQVLKDAKKPSTDYRPWESLEFIGKPTKAYPSGRRYTVERVMKIVEKQGYVKTVEK